MGFPGDDGKTYACMQSCTTGGECREGYICSADSGVTNDQGLGFCRPHCRNYACGNGYSCNAATGICQEAGGGSSGGTGGTGGTGNQQLVHRTIWQGQVNDRRSTKVTFQVPKDAYALSVVSTSSKTNVSPMVVRLHAPGGRVLFDSNSPFNSRIDLFPFYNLSGGSQHAFMLPNSPAYRVQPGQYTLWMAATARTQLSLDVLMKRGSVRAQQNKLPLSIWILPQNHLNADSAARHRKFQQALQTFKEIYGRMGNEVGPIRYYKVTGTRARDLAVVDDGEFGQLWSLIDRNRAAGLNFVVVDHFSDSGGGQTLGRSGGIPGPPTHPSSPAGGVAVAAAVLPNEDGAYFGGITAHEAGHYLGLRHPTERKGTVFEPLADTPQCGARRDSNANGFVEAGECRGYGTENLMFWQATRIQPKQVTAGQSFVVQHNPSLK